MCKTKMAVSASDPTPVSPRIRPTQSPRTRPTQSPRPNTINTASTSSDPSTSNTTNYTTTTSSTLSNRTSLSNLRDSLSQNPNVYDISEIRTATNNFLSKRHSSSSSTTCWRCDLRNNNTIIFQRKFRRKIEMSQLKEQLSVICRSNHSSVVKLLGASISGDYIYLVYEFIPGANLSNCLRNSKNPNFTVLSTWVARMQVAADLADGLDYIHNKTGLNIILVHNHIKSSSIIITEPSFNAKICHFGCAQLCGEADENEMMMKKKSKIGEITELDDDRSLKGSKELARSNSGIMQFEGVRGYISPEYQATGIATQKSDVYAFGVVLLELLSGKEPYKYKYDKRRGDYTRESVIETARAAIGDADRGRLRRWIDGRLKDSFPVEVAEKMTRVGLDCVEVDPDKRPDMGRVAGKISRWYLESKKWADDLRFSDQITVSLAPR
ncbi:PREDICTED: protein LYK5 isoform X2 [Populus euphratica]|uniref:Protein LYK5 isoform X2 n=1 Tax=Populus euphratica TaxID=75702 RepID=A0AAJ6TM67_POPEU|nr:PREDICTED: protein LYK5 isoform X2 [Populus euphratica]